MAIDAGNGDLYIYEFGMDANKLYKYEPDPSEPQIVTAGPNNASRLDKIWGYNGTLYFTRRQSGKWKSEKGLNFFDGSTVKRVTALENITVHDIVFDAFGKLYIREDKQIYWLKVNKDGLEELTPIRLALPFGKIHITGNVNGDLYILDVYKSVIYQFDPVTEQVTEIGGDYMNHYSMTSLDSFLLDRNNNLIMTHSGYISYYKANDGSKCGKIDLADIENIDNITTVG